MHRHPACHPPLAPTSLARSALSVEHVLPQKPGSASDWGRHFSAEERAHWLHRLGNLVLLHGKLNAQASNKDFGAKKSAWQPLLQYDTHALPLTDRVCGLERWDAAEAAAAQREAVRHAFAAWRLHDVADDAGGAQA